MNTPTATTASVDRLLAEVERAAVELDRAAVTVESLPGPVNTRRRVKPIAVKLRAQAIRLRRLAGIEQPEGGSL